MATLKLGSVSMLVWDRAAGGLTKDSDINDLIGDFWSVHADAVLLSLDAIGDEFLDLSSRRFGEAVQKLTTYNIRCFVIGDHLRLSKGSDAWAAFIRESNRGHSLWFVTDLDELGARLS